MSIFSWFKNLFSKKTKWKNKDDELIECFSDDGYVVLNTDISVAQNQKAIVVAKNKVTDVFSCGEYTLAPATMPLTNKRCKLSKGTIDKRTKQLVLPTKFEGFLLFVNLDPIDLETKSKKLKIKNPKVGTVKYKFLYSYNFVVDNPTVFAKYLLGLSMKIRDKNVKDYINRQLNYELKRNLKKNKIGLQNVLMPDEILDDRLTNEMQASLSKLGISITNFDVKDAIMSKRTTRRIAESVDDGEFEIEYSKENIVEEIDLTEQLDNEIETEDNFNIDNEEQFDSNASDLSSENVYKLPDLQTILGENNDDNEYQNAQSYHTQSFSHTEDNIAYQNTQNYQNASQNFSFNQDNEYYQNANKSQNFSSADNMTNNHMENNYYQNQSLSQNKENNYCIRCGAKQIEDAIFCHKCGTKQTKIKEFTEIDD